MSKKFTPIVDADAAYGEGDWRPLLGATPRGGDAFKLYMIGKQSIDAKLRGFLLPSYDWTLSFDDKAFAASVAACWSDTPDKRLPRHFTPNAFALPLTCYPFLGVKKEHWLSPSNRRNMIGGQTLSNDDVADAFDDLNRWIRRNKAFSDSKKDFYLKAPSMKEDALVPGRSLRFFALARCITKEHAWHNGVIAITQAAYSYCIEQLRWAHRSDDGPARDPNWPHYLLGDPTDPAGALEWHVDKVNLDPKDPYDTNVICFTDQAEILDEKPKIHKISAEVLSSRFLLPDPANWNIPTYEEQVDHMVKTYDAAVTMEMIRGACAQRYSGELPADRPEYIRLTAGAASRTPDGESPDHAETHAPRASRTTREAAPDEGDPVAAVTGASRSSSRVAPTNANPPMPERTSPPKERTPADAPIAKAGDLASPFWAGATGVKPAKKTLEELQAMTDAGQIEGVKVMIRSNTWVSLAESGLVTLPAGDDDAPPMVPADEEPPMVPADEEPPTVPAGSAAGEVTLEGMHARLFPDAGSFQRLAADKQKKAKVLVERAWNATDKGRGTELPDDVVSGLMELLD